MRKCLRCVCTSVRWYIWSFLPGVNSWVFLCQMYVFLCQLKLLFIYFYTAASIVFPPCNVEQKSVLIIREEKLLSVFSPIQVLVTFSHKEMVGCSWKPPCVLHHVVGTQTETESEHFIDSVMWQLFGFCAHAGVPLKHICSDNSNSWNSGNPKAKGDKKKNKLCLFQFGIRETMLSFLEQRYLHACVVLAISSDSPVCLCSSTNQLVTSSRWRALRKDGHVTSARRTLKTQERSARVSPQLFRSGVSGPMSGVTSMDASRQDPPSSLLLCISKLILLFSFSPWLQSARSLFIRCAKQRYA